MQSHYIYHKVQYKYTVKQTSNLVLNQTTKHFVIAYYQDNLISIMFPTLVQIEWTLYKKLSSK